MCIPKLSYVAAYCMSLMIVLGTAISISVLLGFIAYCLHIGVVRLIKRIKFESWKRKG